MSIGIGKSSISRYIGLYLYHRLDCCSNCFTSLRIASGSKLGMAFIHTSSDTAYQNFCLYYKNYVFKESPYFRQLYNNPPIRLIPCGPKSSGALLGVDLIYANLSEINFYSPKDGYDRVSEVLGRVDSRFKNVRFHYIAVVADSSANGVDFSAVKKFEDSVPPDELLTVAEPQWVIRPELYSESKGETFKLYLGDAIREPYIIDNEDDIQRENLDTDRIMNVPVSAKYRFISSIERSIRDICGIAYDSNTLFFNNNLTHLLNCSKIRNLAPEKIAVDFYDKNDSIFDKVSNMVYRIPRGAHIYLHTDIGLKQDNTGICACILDKEVPVGNSLLPTFKFPFMFVLSRLKGQATSLDHIFQFIQDLIKKGGYYVTYSADSFSSAGIFQLCERENIPYKAISVDKTMDACLMLKNAINTERIETVYHKTLIREVSELRVVYNGKNGDHMKIDHPEISKCHELDYEGLTGDQPGTKDLWDSMAGSFYSAYLDYSLYKEGGVGGGIQKSMKAMDSITKDPREETAKVFQDMIESIW